MLNPILKNSHSHPNQCRRIPAPIFPIPCRPAPERTAHLSSCPSPVGGGGALGGGPGPPTSRTTGWCTGRWGRSSTRSRSPARPSPAAGPSRPARRPPGRPGRPAASTGQPPPPPQTAAGRGDPRALVARPFPLGAGWSSVNKCYVEGHLENVLFSRSNWGDSLQPASGQPESQPEERLGGTGPGRGGRRGRSSRG